MLLLTRLRGEGFQIGADIHVKVVSVINGQVKIGIDAPKEMFIARDEIVAKMQAEKDRSAQEEKDPTIEEASHVSVDS